MKFIDYFFHCFYRAILFKSWVENDTSYINTYLGIACMLTFNILSVLYLIEVEWLNKNTVLIIPFSLIILSYFTFVFKKRYLKIIDKYKHHDPYPKLGLALVIIYIVFSFAFVSFSAWWGRQKYLDLIV